MRYALFFLALALAFPAYAQETSIDAVCRLLPEYKPSADVDYKPGVDVHGKPVVSADLNAAPPATFDVIKLPVTVDLAQRLGAVPPAAGLELKPQVAFMLIHKDGRVEYNGRNVSSQVATACGDAAVLVGAAPKAPVVPEAQPEPVQQQVQNEKAVVEVAPVAKVEKAPMPPVQKPAEKPVEVQAEKSHGQEPSPAVNSGIVIERTAAPTVKYE